ncbi:phosphate ABC transporter ATP-binding protein [Vagococcus coleopterorum]|uniref:Phosphate ABC transporter ATP-binding protein n=1 Tax=Vagococcus coleopterorum TaxID=2714946 RepID=A0A6G8AN17_9ENTE|nr:phosphate ABC transporter ATP-binding protein PstB [Vagococcus coleopterorum]QIL46474.1 phosphate ABC transporter ATP-binding protein [Vagococcus coleopterorum]
MEAVKKQNVALDIKALSVYYGTHQAVKAVDMVIPKNKISALIGPSGCGKSTFLKALNRMHDVSDNRQVTGQIIYQDIDVNTDKVDQYLLRQKIGMVFQKPNPFRMSIRRNISFALERHGLKDKQLLADKVETSLKQVGLWDEVKDELDKSALALSGGQQQRLCIARVLAMEPDIILMDEPTSALDPISTGKIEETLDELKKDYTIIMVTHNLAQASRLSDYTGFFNYGELIEYDNTAKIFTDPAVELTHSYITGEFG